MNPDSLPSPRGHAPPVGVRYSLPELLEELKMERASGSFGMEKLEQADIGKLFKTPPRRRAKPSK
jgi:hypothetical protein